MCKAIERDVLSILNANITNYFQKIARKGKIIGTKSNKDPPYKNHRNGGHRGLLQKKNS